MMLMFCSSVPMLLEQEFNSNLSPRKYNLWLRDGSFLSAKATANSQPVFLLKGSGKMTVQGRDLKLWYIRETIGQEYFLRGNLKISWAVSFLFSLAFLPRPRQAIYHWSGHGTRQASLERPAIGGEFNQMISRALLQSQTLWIWLLMLQLYPFLIRRWTAATPIHF